MRMPHGFPQSHAAIILQYLQSHCLYAAQNTLILLENLSILCDPILITNTTERIRRWGIQNMNDIDLSSNNNRPIFSSGIPMLVVFLIRHPCSIHQLHNIITGVDESVNLRVLTEQGSDIFVLYLSKRSVI